MFFRLKGNVTRWKSETMQRKEDSGNEKYEDTFNSPHTNSLDFFKR